MEPLAKPTGILLADHTQHVGAEATALLDAAPYPAQKYAALTGHDLRRLVLKAAEWHDVGKQDGWQAACQKDHAAYQNWVRRGQRGRFVATELQKGHFRHELDSLRRLHDPKNVDCKLPMCAYAAIAAHHGKLGYKHEHRWQRHEKHRWFWRQFLQKANSLNPDDATSFEAALDRKSVV